MNKAPDEIFEQAVQECLDEGLNSSVYNNSLRNLIYDDRVKKFSFLEISLSYKDLKRSKRIPNWYDFNKPNASKYNIMNYNLIENGEVIKGIWMIDDEERSEAAVRILKKIHGIKDPWDDDPDWFKTNKPGDEL